MHVNATFHQRLRAVGLHGAARKAKRAKHTQKGRQRDRQALSSAKSLFWLTTLSRHAKRQAGHTEDKGTETTEMEQAKLATISGDGPERRPRSYCRHAKEDFG